MQFCKRQKEGGEQERESREKKKEGKERAAAKTEVEGNDEIKKKKEVEEVYLFQEKGRKKGVKISTRE